VLAGPSTDEIEGALAAERTIVANAKKIGLLVAGAASQKYMQELANQQEIMGAIADIIIETFAMESAVLRTVKLVDAKGEKEASLATAMTQIYIAGAIARVESAAKKIMAAVAEGDMLRTQLMILRRLVKQEPVNVIALQQQVAQRVLDANKYTF
jgi:butyryl-CoA dehydrogenase